MPVSLDVNDRASEYGINGCRAIVRQTRAALDILEIENPDRIITLGGECSVSVVPFTYLAAKYPDDVAIVWIDAHPDICLPFDSYEGYHAMAVTACIGMGDETLMNMLPAKIDNSRTLIVGLRECNEGMQECQQELGLKGLSPAETATDSSEILK